MPNHIAGIPLPLLRIEDEFGRSRLRVAAREALAGNQIRFEDQAINRPLDLVGDADGAWMLRPDLVALRALADIPGQLHDMEINGQAKRVVFRNEDGGAIEAEPIKLYGDPPDTLRYRNIRIKLWEIES